MEKHVELLDEALRRLKAYTLYPKFSKCEFAVGETEYLGFRVGANGVRPSRSKIEAIEIWPSELKNDSQVRQFLGTVNY